MQTQLKSIAWSLALLAAFSLATAPVLGQAAAPPAAAPAAGEPLRYQVYEVKGRVYVAKAGTDPKLKEGWRRVRRGENLIKGQQIRTSLRSAIKLVAYPAEPPTVIMIERASLVSIAELRYVHNSAKSRIKLAYGAIRAGVAEGVIRSDMEIECPVATLSKKGTDIFRFEYRNGRWKMSLSALGRGQIMAIQNRYAGIVGGRSWTSGFLRTRNVFPGQFVTDQMVRTIESTLFDRDVNINDLFGLKGIELQFNTLFGNGTGFLLLGRNPIEVRETTQRDRTDDTNTAIDMQQQMSTTPPGGGESLLLRQAIDSIRDRASVQAHPGGDFGIGTGFLPNIIVDTTARVRLFERLIPHPPRLLQAQQKAALKRAADGRKHR